MCVFYHNGFYFLCIQLEGKYSEYKLNVGHGKSKDFPSKMLREIIEVSSRFLLWYPCLELLLFFVTCFLLGKSCTWFWEGNCYKWEACWASYEPTEVIWGWERKPCTLYCEVPFRGLSLGWGTIQWWHSGYLTFQNWDLLDIIVLKGYSFSPYIYENIIN